MPMVPPLVRLRAPSSLPLRIGARGSWQPTSCEAGSLGPNRKTSLEQSDIARSELQKLGKGLEGCRFHGPRKSAVSSCTFTASWGCG